MIATELIFDNKLDDMTPAEIVALFSSLIFEERSDQPLPKLNIRLEKAKSEITSLACTLALTQMDCGLDTPPEDYCKVLNFSLMHVVFEWASGTVS